MATFLAYVLVKNDICVMLETTEGVEGNSMFSENLIGKNNSLFGPYYGIISEKQINCLETEKWSGAFTKKFFGFSTLLRF